MYFLFLLFFATLPSQFALSPAPGIDLHISRIFALGLGALWITVSLFRRKLLFSARAETFLLFSFLFLSAFSLFFADNISWGFRKLVFLFSFVSLFFVAFSVLQEDIYRKKFAQWIVIGSALAAGIGIIQFLLPFAIGLDPALLLWQKNILPIFSGHTFSGVVSEYSSMVVSVDGTNLLRASAFFPDPHIASFFWGMTLPFALALALLVSGWKRVYFSIASLFIFSADLLTFSRGGYLALIVALIVFLGFFFSSLLKKYIPFLFAFCFVLILLIAVPNPLTARLSSIFDFSDHSTSGRVAIWNEAIGIITDHPITGVGLGNYSNTVLSSATYREPRYAHNIFLDISAETGIVNGIVFFLLLALSIIRALTSSEPLKLAAGFSLLIFFVHSLFETPIYSVHILPLFLTLIAIGLSNTSTKLLESPLSCTPRPQKRIF
jgi:O-antigen ligase